MAIIYAADVANCRSLGSFHKLLFRWTGSVYKLVWQELITFLLLYFLLETLHGYMDEAGQKTFEAIMFHFHSYASLIPLSFVLGFYVSLIMQRWEDQYLAIPWPDPTAVYVSSLLHGMDDRSRLMRRTIMRYECLAVTMVFSMIAPRIKRRFATWDNFVEAGLLEDSEKQYFEEMTAKSPKQQNTWMPIVWAAAIVSLARREGRIRDDFSKTAIVDALNRFQNGLVTLLRYDAVNVPLVYTQVVTLAVYAFFLCSMLAAQYENLPKITHFASYLPFFTLLQFFFYIGWLKVAEVMINPFGEDDDDYDLGWIVDRNLKICYLIVDGMHDEHPELLKDQYWDTFPVIIPYADDVNLEREHPPEPSTWNVEPANFNIDINTGELPSNRSSLSRNSVIEEETDKRLEGGDATAHSSHNDAEQNPFEVLRQQRCLESFARQRRDYKEYLKTAKALMLNSPKHISRANAEIVLMLKGEAIKLKPPACISANNLIEDSNEQQNINDNQLQREIDNDKDDTPKETQKEKKKKSQKPSPTKEKLD